MASARTPTAARPLSSNWIAANRPILIVDDDEGVRTILSEYLTDLGYAAAVAEHGRAALARIRHFQPALIFLDLRMPVMDGWAFLDAYRHLGGWQAPIIVLTASPDAAQVAARVGAAGYLAKPFDLDDLAHLVASYADRPTGRSTAN